MLVLALLEQRVQMPQHVVEMRVVEAETEEQERLVDEVALEHVLEDQVAHRVPFVVFLADDDFVGTRDVAMHLVEDDVPPLLLHREVLVARLDVDADPGRLVRLFEQRIEIGRPDGADRKTGDDLVIAVPLGRLVERALEDLIQPRAIASPLVQVELRHRDEIVLAVQIELELARAVTQEALPVEEAR